MLLFLIVSLGGALDSGLRFLASGWVANHFGATFPWGTLVVNVTGSYIIGFVNTLTGPGGRVFASGSTRQFFMTGICGGYTAFSSFSLQTLNLAQEGEWLHAGANVVFSVVCCLVAVWLGHPAAGYLNQMKGT
ncbi:MAG TPA: fluoride efflux transporter CrcB [Lacunisphaera sp.]|nr:fluoride efflux transporter CrcB [Lacunisphaera sp.]